MKSIETRSWSTTYRGPLAIHAAVRPPTATDFGDSIPARAGWIGAYNLGRWAAEQHHADPCDCDLDEEQAGEACMAASAWEHALFADEGAHGFSLATTLPLGAIVATCTLDDVVPMVDTPSSVQHPGPVLDVRPTAFGRRMEIILKGGRCWRVEDQLPYGDFTPGRFAWLLVDIKPTVERCPDCWGKPRTLLERERYRHHITTCGASNGSCFHPACRCGCHQANLCPTCSTRGHCDPIPAKGHQRLWEWTP